MSATPYLPRMTRAGLAPTHAVSAIDEYGARRELRVAGEFPLTIKVDQREVVTLMTLGTRPEELTLGYLRNQRLIEAIEDIRAVDVNWERGIVQVETVHGDGVIDWEQKLAHRTVTTGCGQGTVFSCTLDKLYDVRLPQITLRQSVIYRLLDALSGENEIYRSAGAVHGCALCHETAVLHFVEDVGRHNAADAISGRMWLDRIDGADKIFYTTGRLTSEIVMKAAHMGIPVLLSRSGVTHMGLELAQELGIVMIARAKGRHFLVYHGADSLVLDAVPVPGPRGVSAAEARAESA
ncbi:MAG: formate dehydrogenase family accessory protein FdhD [Acidithiobacillales bacterium SM23_46]|jgi:FdhD protein|nr:MAG: formate dehydrogenase family accessory protein FdhD [Acidithiobacillales bacterium SM23_46]KPL27575.1 MAG: formate dehydrogenase family accessory protein FdhD [Acidithiobacillales bacterium SM1_46]